LPSTTHTPRKNCNSRPSWDSSASSPIASS
jgi:hypothetical protein